MNTFFFYSESNTMYNSRGSPHHSTAQTDISYFPSLFLSPLFVTCYCMFSCNHSEHMVLNSASLTDNDVRSIIVSLTMVF